MRSQIHLPYGDVTRHTRALYKRQLIGLNVTGKPNFFWKKMTKSGTLLTGISLSGFCSVQTCFSPLQVSIRMIFWNQNILILGTAACIIAESNLGINLVFVPMTRFFGKCFRFFSNTFIYGPGTKA